ncbi:hypothetical protein PDL71_05915 [Lacibacter sp. MH-610]|uniref:hypothetical protein n=1 Tax=Lacibacter sp. MH-610 TaxID=3020883 RepID=UPI003891C60D
MMDCVLCNENTVKSFATDGTEGTERKDDEHRMLPWKTESTSEPAFAVRQAWQGTMPFAQLLVSKECI